MLRTIALAALIGFVSAAATAQQKPAPSPSPAGPAPGTTAYMTKSMDVLEKANRDYENLTYDPKASVAALNQALRSAADARAAVGKARPAGRVAPLRPRDCHKSISRFFKGLAGKNAKRWRTPALSA